MIRTLILSAAVAGLSLYGGHEATAAPANAGAGQQSAAHGEAGAPGNMNSLQLVKDHQGSSGWKGPSSGWKGPSSGWKGPSSGWKGPSSGWKGPSNGWKKGPSSGWSGNSSGWKKGPVSGWSGNSSAWKDGVSHRRHNRHRHHHHGGVWIGTYYDYGYDYSSCYDNCRYYHGPRFCNIYWRDYCD